jgi:hypothetical protein
MEPTSLSRVEGLARPGRQARLETERARARVVGGGRR